MKIIGITGNSGVGKTTISKKLSEKLKCPYVDIDKRLMESELFDENTDKKRNYDRLKPEHFKLFIDSLNDMSSLITIIINAVVQNEFDKIPNDTDIVIVEWMLLPYLKIWDKCDVKILINVDENLRKSNSIKNNLISEEEYDKCFDFAKVDYEDFDYDFIFENKYSENIINEIFEKLKYFRFL